jgi:hypothetical protein
MLLPLRSLELRVIGLIAHSLVSLQERMLSRSTYSMCISKLSSIRTPEDALGQAARQRPP